MITKLATHLLKEAEARWSKVWNNLSEEAKAILRNKGVVKSETNLANGLYKKFHMMNNPEFSYHGTPNKINPLRKYLGDIGSVARKVEPTPLSIPGIDNLKSIARVVHPEQLPVPGGKGLTSVMTQGGYASLPHHMELNSLGEQFVAPPVIGMMDPSNIKNRILSPFHKVISNAPQTAIRHNIMANHELNEIKAMHAPDAVANTSYIFKKDNGLKTKLYNKIQERVPSIGLIAKDDQGNRFQRAGTHMNLGILGNEANDVRKANIINKSIASPLVNARNDSTEAGILKNITGKNYGEDKFTGKDINKLVKHRGNKLIHLPTGSGMATVL